MEYVYIIFKDAEIYLCCDNPDLAEKLLEDRMSRDPDQQYTWSIIPYKIRHLLPGEIS
jgi:hypothetical protein